MDLITALPLYAWALIGGFFMAVCLAVAIVVFIRGQADLSLARTIDSLKETETSLAGRITSKEKELDALMKNTTQAKQLIEEAHAAKQWLNLHQSELVEKQERIVQLEQNIKHLGEQKEALTSEISTLTEKNFNLQTTGDRLVLRQNSLETQHELLKTAHEQLQREKTRLNEQITKLSTDLDVLRRESVTLEARAEQARVLKQEIEDAERRKKELHKDIDEADQRLIDQKAEAKVAEEKLKELRFTTAANDNIWKDLETPVIGFSEDQPRPAISTAESQWLESVYNTFSEKGFSFNPRILTAFHTGLKCGEMTPLVVLAGISGTGKSLLPELYATAAGMNFLSVAVQPRWDSPQDLFGFFNYMEGRYKATELARFLWQIDRYNNVKRALRDDSLSIVLLDEMNLSRVEYYFSDLLSKLELRRGLDPDSDARTKAEIELECNARTEKLKGRRLFIHSDTFFVGTMNEDETTQMLSDKVIDRSNVLRFGKPAHMADQPFKTAILEHYRHQPRITSSTWKKWKLHPNTSAFDNLAKEPLERLNNAFATIGRPFGQRVWQSVKRYMSYYPVMSFTDASGETLQLDERTAFADQLEMKILPKLNGLELNLSGVDHVRSELDSILSSLNDEALKTAFDQAFNPDINTFFKWRGVMR